MELITFFQHHAFTILFCLAILWIVKNPIMAKIYRIPFLTADEAHQAYLQNTARHLFLDVRTALEVEETGKIKQAIHIPLSELSKRLGEIGSPGDAKRIVVVCHSGRRAIPAVIKLKKAGFLDAAVMQGGMASWRKAGKQVSQVKNRRSLKRARGVEVVDLEVGYFYQSQPLLHDQMTVWVIEMERQALMWSWGV